MTPSEAGFQTADFGLTGRHVVVTGGGRGLGRALAIAAAQAGATVTIMARSAGQLAETAAAIRGLGGDCRILAADLADLAAIPAHVEAISGHAPIDGVVHAAGVQLRKPAVEVTIDEWRRVQTTNADAPFFLSTAIAAHQLREQRRGSHVFVGSLTSTIGLANAVPYTTSKSAMLGMARGLSTEWAGRGLRANVIGPGYFETALTADLLADPANRARILSRIPMDRLGAPQDLAGVAVFLLSDASTYLTGQLINVDGGWLAS
jgi:2-deoxy-D-gluconate 3-dehydrogenase